VERHLVNPSILKVYFNMLHQVLRVSPKSLSFTYNLSFNIINKICMQSLDVINTNYSLFKITLLQSCSRNIRGHETSWYYWSSLCNDSPSFTYARPLFSPYYDLEWFVQNSRIPSESFDRNLLTLPQKSFPCFCKIRKSDYLSVRSS
jgi:hypothetical protein